MKLRINFVTFITGNSAVDGTEKGNQKSNIFVIWINLKKN